MAQAALTSSTVQGKTTAVAMVKLALLAIVLYSWSCPVSRF